jgi:hypothetical protein
MVHREAFLLIHDGPLRVLHAYFRQCRNSVEKDTEEYHALIGFSINMNDSVNDLDSLLLRKNLQRRKNELESKNRYLLRKRELQPDVSEGVFTNTEPVMSDMNIAEKATAKVRQSA